MMTIELTGEQESATKKFLEHVNARSRRKNGVTSVRKTTAVRFLFARKFDVGRALALYDQHELTRQREGLFDFDATCEPLISELKTGKFSILPGRDSGDAAIAVFTAHKHVPTTSTHQTTLQGVVYQLDVALQCPITQRAGIVFIYDMSHSKYSNFDYDLSQKILTLLKLDAKKSPLALLAQTCSQIGADTPNAKLLQSSGGGGGSEKKSSSSSLKVDKDKSDKQTSSNYYKPYETHREKSKTPEERSSSTGSRVRTPNNTKSGSNSNGRSSAHSVTNSPKASPNGGPLERKTPSNCGGEVTTRHDGATTPSKLLDHRTSPVVQQPPKTNSNSSSSNSSSISVASSLAPLTSVTDHLAASRDLHAHAMSAYKASTVPLPPTTSAYYGAGYPHLGMDLMTASSLMSHHAAMKSSAAGLNPYLSYAAAAAASRMKAPGSDPLCRDPYCTGCAMSSHHLLGLKPPTSAGVACPAGCTQCDHVSKSHHSVAAAAAAAAASMQSYHHLPAHNAAYAHAQLAALAAASHLPYVCNWISGDAAYCGKRFSSSEELLAHLRTHTSVNGSAPPPNVPTTAASTAAEAVAALSAVTTVSSPSAAALSMLSATHPLFHRTYPTPPLSPLASAAAAAARYHPYSKPSLLPPPPSSPLTSYSLGPPGLPPYLSPYSLYGPPPPPSASSRMHP